MITIARETDKTVDDQERFVAYRRVLVNDGRQRKLTSWEVTFRGQTIGSISKQDTKWVHDNFEVSISFGENDKPLHPFVSRESRPVVMDELRRLASKVCKAFHAGESTIVAA